MFIYLCSHVELVTLVPSQLIGWRASPSSQPLGSVYVKLLGHEIAFINIDEALVEEVIKVNPPCLLYIRISDIHVSTSTISDIFWEILSPVCRQIL